MAKQEWFRLTLFALAVCSIGFLFQLAALGKSQIVLTVPARNGISIGSSTLLGLLASLAPAIVLLASSKQCRANLFRFSTSGRIYFIALLVGTALPFASYLGAAHSYPLWNSHTPLDLLRIFVINIFLTPLWEEVIWRGYFYSKLSFKVGVPQAILVSSIGWTIWHAGFIYFLYERGISAAVVPIFLVQTFLGGVILCSVFTLAGNSIAPCVLLHCAFNASNTVYYRSYGRVSGIGSYAAEALASLLVSAIIFVYVVRKAGSELSAPTSLPASD